VEYGRYYEITQTSISDTMTIDDNFQHWKKQSEDLEVDWKNRIVDGGE